MLSLHFQLKGKTLFYDSVSIANKAIPFTFLQNITLFKQIA